MMRAPHQTALAACATSRPIPIRLHSSRTKICTESYNPVHKSFIQLLDRIPAPPATDDAASKHPRPHSNVRCVSVVLFCLVQPRQDRFRVRFYRWIECFAVRQVLACGSHAHISEPLFSSVYVSDAFPVLSRSDAVASYRPWYFHSWW